MSRTSTFAAVALALAAAGCASLLPPSLPPGTPMSEAEARIGKPRAVVPAPGGITVWQYPTGPVGQTTWMVEFGPDQRVRSVYQALTEAQMAKIVPGATTRDEVRLLLGPPGETMRFGRMGEETWSYRYQTGASGNWIFNVNFDAGTRIVRSTGQQIDPLFTEIFNTDK